MSIKSSILVSQSITKPSGPGENAYPISSFTWLRIPNRNWDRAGKEAIVGFLKWLITDGQKFDEALSYARLPESVVSKEMRPISKIQ